MDSRIASCAAALLLALFSGLLLGAQNPKHESQLKTVRGVVTDKSDNPIPAGVVFLKDTRTNQVRSNIHQRSGRLPVQRNRSQRRIRIVR